MAGGAEREEFVQLLLRMVLCECKITRCIIGRRNVLSMPGEGVVNVIDCFTRGIFVG